MTDPLPSLDPGVLEKLELFFLGHPFDRLVGQAMAETGATMHEALFVALFEIERIATEHGVSGALLLRAAAEDREAFREKVEAAHEAEDALENIVRRHRNEGAADDGLNDGG